MILQFYGQNLILAHTGHKSLNDILRHDLQIFHLTKSATVHLFHDQYKMKIINWSARKQLLSWFNSFFCNLILYIFKQKKQTLK